MITAPDSDHICAGHPGQPATPPVHIGQENGPKRWPMERQAPGAPMLTALRDNLFTTLSRHSIPLSLFLAAFPWGSPRLSTSSSLQPGILEKAHLASRSRDQGLRRRSSQRVWLKARGPNTSTSMLRGGGGVEAGVPNYPQSPSRIPLLLSIPEVPTAVQAGIISCLGAHSSLHSGLPASTPDTRARSLRQRQHDLFYRLNCKIQLTHTAKGRKYGFAQFQELSAEHLCDHQTSNRNSEVPACPSPPPGDCSPFPTLAISVSLVFSRPENSVVLVLPAIALMTSL